MDKFQATRSHYLGTWGIKCPCCNYYRRTNNNSRDKKLNRMTRRRLKQQTNKLIIELLTI